MKLLKKCVIIPDSFKGTMSSIEICRLAETAVRKHFPECAAVSLPVADGGEGTTESFLTALGGKRVELRVTGPHFGKVNGFYGIIGERAVVEMAAAAGLPLVGDRRDPVKTTTFGVGELMLDALNKGCREIVIGLGGSATNDGGCGAAAALGVKFFDKAGKTFVPVGGNLHEIADIDVSETKKRLEGVRIVAMCDIDNPMFGESGAAYVFGPQKGADAAMVEYLDRNLRSLSDTIKKSLGTDVSRLPGAGAAGAMGAGLHAFFGAELQAGITTVLDTVNFDEIISGADLIITGEGKIDTQSLRGKVVIGVAKRAAPHKVPVVAIVGDIGDNIEMAYDMGLSAVFSINRVAVPFSEAKTRAKSDYMLTADNLMRFLKTIGF